jgi:tetraacyldisaccharide 4'-kinase
MVELPQGADMIPGRDLSRRDQVAREYALDDLELYLLSVMEDRRHGIVPALLRGVASMASWPFAGLAELRRRVYLRGRIERKRAPLPVISVGNLVVGGAGKTPFSSYLLKGLSRQGRQVAVIARGYRSGKSDAVNDELIMLGRQVPDVLTLATPNRLAGCRKAAELGAEVAVLDDGFQHIPLLRDLDILLLDATRPFGNNRLLPRGTLREPPECARRADLAVLTRVDLASRGQVGELHTWLGRLKRGMPVTECRFRPTTLKPVVAGSAPPVEPESLSGRHIGAFAGLADPRGFGRLLRALGAVVVYSRRFRDHHRYTSRDLAEVAAEARWAGAELLVTTEKDAVKLGRLASPESPLYYLPIEVEMLEGEDRLWAEVGRALANFKKP